MTPRQQQLLAFIASYQGAHGGVSPSLDEMTVELRLVSRGSAHRLLGQLETEGRIRRRKHVRRCIEIVDEVARIPDGALLAEVARRGLMQAVA